MGLDIALTSESFAGEDRSWLKSRKGIGTARPITLDFSLFVSGTHYPNGYLPSGLVLARLTATGRYGYYSDAGTAGAGTDVAHGFLLTSVTVPTSGTGRSAAAMLFEGIVDTTELPSGHGLTTAARADLTMVRFEPIP